MSGRSRFYLVDPSLERVGGHYFEYALHVARAAAARGYRPVLAAHEGFDGGEAVPGDWPVHSLYPVDARSDPSFLPRPNLGDRVRRRTTLLLDARERVRGWSHAPRYRRHRQEFLRATAELFRREPLAPGDQVFLATASTAILSDLLGYLAERPETRRVDWHVQFHNNPFLGRDPEHDRQMGRVRKLRATLERARRDHAHHRLHFYTTTAQLTAQYERLGPLRFHTLPYPVNAEFRTCGAHRSPRTPYLATYVGDARREKGYQHLPAAVEGLWSDYVETGKLRFVIQSNFAFRPGRRSNLPVLEARARLSPLGSDRVQLIDEPLSTDAYRELVLATDLALLPYDPERYYARCSGVLVEMLSSGTPVIVSAGCWLAEQIEGAAFDHREAWMGRMERLDAGAAPTAPAHADALRFAAAPARLAATPGGGATHAFLSFRWNVPAGPGAYARVAWSAATEDRPPARGVEIVGRREGGRAGVLMLPLPRRTRHVELELTNAFGPESIELREARLEVRRHDGPPPPLGAVGLIAAEPQRLAPLVADVVDHYDHYRRTAAAFAHLWTRWHRPERVVQELLSCADG